jgi:hypothetical protein
VARTPYPGLRPFERDEADIFFGRETHIDAMINRLARQRLLVVTGSSGSGKSSLVRAGLLEALEMGLLAEAGSLWRFAVLRPRDHPMQEFAAALLEAAEGESASPETIGLRRAALERGPLSLVQELRDRPLPEGGNLLILVDQFEELFRYRGLAGREEAEAFVALLLASAEQRDMRIYVVLTMRSDFFGECAQFEGLAEAVCDSLYLCPRLTRDQIIAAIEGPARVFGGTVERSLVARLANDMGSDPDQLPLMQHALMRLWDRSMRRERGKPLLRLEDYIAAGGLRGSLSGHADEILSAIAFSKPERVEVARRLFCLVTEGEGDRAVRRLAPVAEVMAVSEQPLAEVAAVADAFRAPEASLLMPPAADALSEETILDISHESLIRNWQTLKDWARQEVAAATRYRETERRVQQRLGGETAPWQPPEIDTAMAWIEQDRPNGAWAARYGGNFTAMRGFLDDARRRQRKARVAVQISLAALAIETVILAGASEGVFVFWLIFIASTFWTVHRNLGRNFAAARQWANVWASFYAMVCIAVLYAVHQKGTMLVQQGTGCVAILIAVPCLIYASMQLRHLTRSGTATRPAAIVDIDRQRLKRARYAILAVLALGLVTSVGELVYAILKAEREQYYGAASTLLVIGAMYWSPYRSLTRNLALARVATGAWAAVTACFTLFDIGQGWKVFIATNGIATALLTFALFQLWQPPFRIRWWRRSGSPAQTPSHRTAL